ncbi:glycine--tRNA ligase beta subunit [Amylibacter marinus]|uniref:Glycine--tRNA ligase beta subunit n=1 Tax=Amylibacter marinus TaxID=1475483 RepID=A0ABQ5VTA7_9RHOB|nr:glycine--tRNA ligase subunit beta [Amylibacter marinus]GLQ34575.1 glycine--tRNA ligase beta subunit [Amylibacter marinus]
MADLLLELFSEEIPARMQARAAADLKKLVTDALVDAGITYADAGALSTPRRLCLTIDGLLDKSPDLTEERKGPRVDAPEQALNGFLRGVGLTKDQLEIRDDKKGQTYYAVMQKPGRTASEILAEVLPQIIRNFPWPKSMRWGSSSLRWVRPLHSILCILSAEDGAEIVDFEIDGIESANLTAGHRFLAPQWFSVKSFAQYQTELKSAFVMLDSEERAEHIWEDAKNMAFAAGLELVEDSALLAEVAGLVEWPVVLMGDIAPDFMNLPPEVLITSMREHQKFFSVKNAKTGQIEKFITVANRTTADNGATILAGNQKVLFARLSDAKFFWENDLRIAKAGMDVWADKLTNVTFHNKLGTQAERIDRIAKLARELAPIVGADADLAAKAAKLAKADLSSEMVGEFAKLQGLMGRYYAAEAGLPDEIGAASEEHYSPLGPTDTVPSAPVSVAVAMADKLDTLTSFWAIDEKPTGSKDPFALRRAALGVIRLILENSVRVDLLKWLGAQTLAGGGGAVDLDNLLSFFHDRLKVYLKDAGIKHDVIDACLAMPRNDDFSLLVNRARALQGFRDSADGENLLQGFKRANNILTAEEKKDGVFYELDPEAKLAEDDAEKALFSALDTAQPLLDGAIKAEDFTAAMAALAALRAPIDGFFEHVQVNADSEILRRNRLCLLNRIRSVMNSVAAFEKIEG